MARNLSTFDIAAMLGVDPGSVANWIDQDLLNAHRTPGGHRRVAVEDLLAFLRVHKMPVPSELQTGPKKILIVDDDPAVTKLIAKTVRKEYANFELLEAHDGFRAGAAVANLKPDVVILDLKMPGIDGYEVCRAIKSEPASRHIEVIAITAYPSEDGTKRILNCGARVCLSKPLNMNKLLAEIAASIS